MSSAESDEIVDLVRRSGLVEDERLDRFQAERLDDVSDRGEILRRFVVAELLTQWQADRIAEGRWRGFFLGKYKLLSPLGAGAMGSVFLAEHKVMRHRVAIKALAKRLLAKPANITRFEREARAAASLAHPNVVRAFDIDRNEEGVPYLVMEFVDGADLQKHVFESPDKALDPRLAAEYTRQVALGLDAAHKAGLVHRDIKPSNLLLDKSGLVKVLDMGLARIIDDDVPSLTIMNDSKLIGTVDYLSPEQALDSHKIDGRADLYSLGCTLYFLLTGSPPFPSGSLTERILKHQTRRPMEIAKRRAERNLSPPPEALCRICDRMMEKSPHARYATGAAVAEALADFLAGKSDVSDAGTVKLQEDDGARGSSIGGQAARSGGGSSVRAQAANQGTTGDELTLAPDSETATPKPSPAKPSRPTPTPSQSPAARAGKSAAASGVAAGVKASASTAGAVATASPSVDVLEALPDMSSGPQSFGGSLGAVFDEVVGAALSNGPLSASGSSGGLASGSGKNLPSGSLDLPAAKTLPTSTLTPAPAPQYASAPAETAEVGGLPLWALVGAGIFLGLIGLAIFFGYVTGFINLVPREVEQKSMEGPDG